jgi:hypothetical protein
MAPIIIKYLDGDRISLTMSVEEFLAMQIGLKHLNPSLITEADRRLIQAFEDFNNSLRAEIAEASKNFPLN